MEAPIDAPGRENWREVIAHRPDVKLNGVDAFAGHLALHERANGITRVAIRDTGTGDTHVIDQPEEIYTAYTNSNPEFETSTLRFGYTSLVTPMSIYDYDVTRRGGCW